MMFTNLGDWLANVGTIKTEVINRTGGATVRGGVYMFDLLGSDGDVTAGIIHGENSVTGNIIQVTAPVLPAEVTEGNRIVRIYCVAEEVAADNNRLTVTIRGFTKAIADTGGVVAGQLLTVTASERVDAVPASAYNFGFALEAINAAALGRVYFNGLGMFM